jgi:hypothetical protein
MATKRSAVRPRSPSCTSDESRQVSCRASTARAVADAGLLISWARPAASVPRATSASRWVATASMFRTVWKKPATRWPASGNTERVQRPKSSAGTRNIRPDDAARPVAV